MTKKEIISLLYVLAVALLHTLNLGDAAQWNEDHLGPFRTDLVVHFLMFLPWAYFAAGTWEPKSISLPGISPFQTFFLCGIVFAILMETTQAFIPYRTFSGLDMLMNTLSTATGYSLRTLLKSLRRTGND